MNSKIAGQSTKTNYQNTGSSASAVYYNEHDLREFLGVALELGIEEEQMHFFDMEGHIVTAAEVMDKIDRHHSGLHKEDAKFFCIMLDPSDPEIAAMGANLKEQLSNGQQYVFDVMDAYAKNFHREGIEDRHNLTAYAIPHLFKGEEKKQQTHWHIIVARKDALNQYKLSPLTNHRGTTKGAVKGGFDRVAFDKECERLFDERFGYERKVEESFDYCLAQKKGTPEQKAEQTQRLADQNKTDIEAAVKAFLDQRVAQLAAEATARVIAEQKAKDVGYGESSVIGLFDERNTNLTEQVELCLSQTYSLIKTANIEQKDIISEIKKQYSKAAKLENRLISQEIDDRNFDHWIKNLVFSGEIGIALAILYIFMKIITDLIEGKHRETKKEIKQVNDQIKALDSMFDKNIAEKIKYQKQLSDIKGMREQLERIIDEPEEKDQRTLQGFMEGYAKHVAEKGQTNTGDLSGKLSAYRRKAEILEVFSTSKNESALSLNLASHGLSIRAVTSNRGVEDISITAGGETPFTVDASKFGQEYLHQILTMYEAATKRKPAYRTEQELQNVQRIRNAQNATRNAMEIKAAQEAAKKEAQRRVEQTKPQVTVTQSKGNGRGIS